MHTHAHAHTLSHTQTRYGTHLVGDDKPTDVYARPSGVFVLSGAFFVGEW